MDEAGTATVAYRQPGKTYRLNEDSVGGNVDGIEAVRQAVYHILATERYSNPIYDDDYGVEAEQYVGQPFEVVLANLPNTITDALLQDDRITKVTVGDIEKVSGNSCRATISVTTIYGKFEEEVSVVQ